MKRKIFKFIPLTLLFSLIFSVNVFAAGFTQDATGIHYQKDDGTNVTSAWVEVSNLWFLFDANGICVNPTGALAPDDSDGFYQIVTSYTPFATTDTALLNQCITNGTVVQVDGQYFITPEASTVMRNANLAAANNTGNNFDTYNNTEQQQTTANYVLNNNTKKIHYPSCSSVPKIAPHNYATSSQTVEELIALGYTTCGICFK
ncbi:MAG: hypothetical protein K1W35_14810 [Lachnospiraceae bacterium]